MINPSALIEAILFYKAEPVKISRLAEILSLSEAEIGEALEALKSDLTNRGLEIIEKDREIILATTAEVSEVIDKITKEELAQDLGKAALETLAIVAYRGEVSRAEIDYIRGVNSSFILRNLMIRGLLERIPNPHDSRGYLYRPTFDFLAHLGLTSAEQLPDFALVQEEIKTFLQNTKDENEEV